MLERTRSSGTPPYTSYRTFKTFIEDLHEHGVPSRIDRSVLTRFSGVVGTQLMHALRFLGLIEDDGRPPPRSPNLRKAHDPGLWPKKSVNPLGKKIPQILPSTWKPP